jgi:hypothetical protein
MRAQNDDSGSALVHNSDHVRDTAQAEPAPMTIGTSLVLIAAGAILKIRGHRRRAGIDLQVVGVILMVISCFRTPRPT